MNALTKARSALDELEQQLASDRDGFRQAHHAIDDLAVELGLRGLKRAGRTPAQRVKDVVLALRKRKGAAPH